MEKLKLMSASELERKVLPPANWAIKDFMPEGLTILAGAPKSGKSILALNIALALSSETEVIGKKGTALKRVLFLPYEDTERRLQDRIIRNKKGLSIKNDPQTFFMDGCNPPKLDNLELSRIGQMIKENKIDLMIIDTLGMSVKNTRKKGLSSYMDEYELLNQFQRFALDQNISVLILHHTRKMKADSVFDEISGTRGITGAADANFVLQKNKMSGYLAIQGRDLEDQNFELEFDKENLTWKFKGIMNSIRLTPEQQSIIDAFENDTEKELKPNEIAHILAKDDTNIRPTIIKLKELGLLSQSAYGKYKLTLIN